MNLKILVVDDEPSLLELVAQFLELESHNIKTANNGQEAFELAQQWSPDLIISDVQMPICNGLQLYEKIQTLPPPTIPILFISGYIGGDEMQMHKKNILGFIAKPFKITDLLKYIENVKPRELSKS